MVEPLSSSPSAYVPSALTLEVSHFLLMLTFIACVLIILSAIVFIIAVTKLRQWDRYYPPLHRWLMAREKAKFEQDRKKRKLVSREKRSGQPPRL